MISSLILITKYIVLYLYGKEKIGYDKVAWAEIIHYQPSTSEFVVLCLQPFAWKGE